MSKFLGFDAGSNEAGYSLILHVPSKKVLHFESVKSGSLKSRDIKALIELVEPLSDEISGVAVEGVISETPESDAGIVFPGRQPKPLFKTATQAGWIVGALEIINYECAYCSFEVQLTTAAQVRARLFRGFDGPITDTDVATLVRFFVHGMPPIRIPVREGDKAMHVYDAAAAALFVSGLLPERLPDDLLAKLVANRIAERTAKAVKKTKKAFGLSTKKKGVHRVH